MAPLVFPLISFRVDGWISEFRHPQVAVVAGSAGLSISHVFSFAARGCSCFAGCPRRLASAFLIYPSGGLGRRCWFVRSLSFRFRFCRQITGAGPNLVGFHRFGLFILLGRATERCGQGATPAILIGRQSLSDTTHGASTVLLVLTCAGSLAVFQACSPVALRVCAEAGICPEPLSTPPHLSVALGF